MGPSLWVPTDRPASQPFGPEHTPEPTPTAHDQGLRASPLPSLRRDWEGPVDLNWAGGPEKLGSGAQRKNFHTPDLSKCTKHYFIRFFILVSRVTVLAPAPRREILIKDSTTPSKQRALSGDSSAPGSMLRQA